MKDVKRIYKIKEDRNFQEVVDCCETCIYRNNLVMWCVKHEIEVYRFSKCDDYTDTIK